MMIDILYSHPKSMIYLSHYRFIKINKKTNRKSSFPSKERIEEKIIDYLNKISDCLFYFMFT